MNDLRFALRLLFRKPGGTLVIIGTLALLIAGAGIALGFIQHEISAWVPFPKSEELVRLWRISKERPIDTFPAAVYAGLREELKGLDSIGAIGRGNSQIMTGRGEPVSFSALEVSASAFTPAGIPPLLGRTFSAEEEHSGESDPVVLSHSIWQSRFGGEESILGESITLNDAPHTVIGIMPPGYDHNTLFYGMDIWLPGNFESVSKAKERVTIIGRLKAGTTMAQLQSELEVVAPPIEKAFDEAQKYSTGLSQARVLPITKEFDHFEAGAVIISIAIPLFVLLIACFNGCSTGNRRGNRLICLVS